MAHEDETAEMAVTLWNADEQNKLGIARDILKVSPFHAYARAVLINKDWENVKGEVAAWEKESGVSPAVLAALGVRYSAEKKFDDAERVLASVHRAFARSLGIPVPGRELQGPRRYRPLAEDARRVPEQGGRPRPRSRPGAGRNRQLLRTA